MMWQANYRIIQTDQNEILWEIANARNHAIYGNHLVVKHFKVLSKYKNP